MAILSAGPLEALLRKHGAAHHQPHLERRARRDANFTKLLGHVWKDSLSSKIWMRVQYVRERQARYAVAEKAAP